MEGRSKCGDSQSPSILPNAEQSMASSSRDDAPTVETASMTGLGQTMSEGDSSKVNDNYSDEKAEKLRIDSTIGHSRAPFSALNLNEVILLEVFAGSARLTAAVRDAGMQGIAVDHDKSGSSGPHIAVYDLNDPEQFAALVQFVQFGERQENLGAFCS